MICAKCGIRFVCPPSAAARRRYCSPECARLAQIGRMIAPRVQGICAVCGQPFEVPARRQTTARYCSFRCRQVGEGRKGGAVTGAQKKARSLGKAYTKTKGRHTHRVVMEQVIGRPLRPGEVVHHRDGNRLNNSPDNLELVHDQQQHTRMHLPGMLAERRCKRGY